MRVADEIIRELAKENPIHGVPEWYGEMNNECFFCQVSEYYDEQKGTTAHHDPSCLWRRAVEYVNSSNHTEKKP